MATNKTIMQIEGRFDPTQILNGLNKIRSEMKASGVKDSLFKGIDKELDNAQKLLSNFSISLQQGVGSSKDVDKLTKEFDKLITSLSKATAGLSGINKETKNFGINTSEINKMEKALNKATQAKEKLYENAKNSITTQMQDIKLTKEQQKTILKEIENQGKLEDALKKVGQAKENAYKEKFNKYILSNNTEVNSAIANIKSKDKREKIYNEAFEKSIKDGATYERTIENIKAAYERKNKAIKDEDALLNKIKADYDAIINAAYNASGANKSQITSQISHATGLGYTDRNGAFQLNDRGNNILNTPNYSAIAAEAQNIANTQAKLNQLNNESARAQENMKRHAADLQNVANTQSSVEQGYRDIAGAQRETYVAQENLNKGFDNMSNVIKNVLSLGAAWSGLKRAFKDTFEDIRKLDTAFGSIAMVTDKTVSELWSSYSDYAEIANKLGQSTENAIKSSALFYQQGLDTAEALSLTEDTMKLATLSGQGFEEATKQMTAALRGFHMEMDQGSHITDVYSELAANAAADVHGIAYAMSKTASIASSAGMSFENTAAFLTNMIETTQEAPENIGTAMKTIIARFTELKENVSASESEFDDLDYNKVDKALKSVSINMKDASGQFRNLDDIFLELSSKWNTLDRNTQRYIATTAAGSRQQSRFIAMMEDYQRTLELVQTAQDSTGRSEEQFSKYADTMQQKINTLKNTWEQLRVSLMDSNFFKGIIDSANNALTKIGQLDFKRLIPTIAIISPIIKSFINLFIDSIKNSSGSLMTAGKTASDAIASGIVSRAEKIANSIFPKENLDVLIEEVQKKIENLQDESIKLENDLRNLTESPEDSRTADYDSQVEAAQKASEANQKAIEEQEEALKKLEDLQKEQEEKEEERQEKVKKTSEAVTAIVQSTVAGIAVLISGGTITDALDTTSAMILATVATKAIEVVSTFATTVISEFFVTGLSAGEAFTAGLSASGPGLAIVAVLGAISAIVAGASHLIKKAQKENESIEIKLEKAEAKLQDLQSKEREANSQAKESKQSYKDVQDLKKKYEELHGIRIKTTEQEKEYNEVVKEIQEQFPNIISFYDETTGKLEVQKNLWSGILQDAKELAKQDSRKAALSGFNTTQQKIAVEELKTNQIEKETNELKYNRNYSNLNDAKYKLMNDESYKNGDASKQLEKINKLFKDKYAINLNDTQTANIRNMMNNTLSLEDIESYGIDIKNTENPYQAYAEKFFENLFDSIDDVIQNPKIDKKKIQEMNANTISNYLQNITNDSVAITGLSARMAQNADIEYKKFNEKDWWQGGKDNYNEWVALGYNADILKTMGITNEKTFDSYKKQHGGAKQAKKDFIEEYNKIAEQTARLDFAEEFDENLSLPQKQLIDTFFSEYNSLTGEQLKYRIDTVSESFGEDAKDVKKFLKDKVKESREELENTINRTYNIDTEAYSANDLQSMINQSQKIAEKYNEEVSKKFAEGAVKLQKNTGIDMTTFVDITTADWSNVDLSNYEEFFANLKEKIIEDQKCTPEEAEEIVKSYKDMAEKAGALDFSTQSIQEIGDKVLEKFKKKIENKKDIATAIKNQIENGFISFSDSETLKEKLKEVKMDANKYITKNLDGTLILNNEELIADYKESEEYAKSLVDAARQANIAKIEQIEHEKQILALKTAQLKIDLLAVDKDTEPTLYNSILDTIKDSDITIKQYEEKIKALKDENSKYIQGTKEYNELVSSIMAAQKELDFTDEIEEAAKKTADAAKKIVEAEKKVAEATKKLNEVLYGTDYHKDALDLLYNYTTNLERLEKKAEDAKDALEDLGNTDNAKELVNTYLSNTHEGIVNREAQNRILQQSIDNRKAVLDNKLNEAISQINSNGENRNISSDINDYYTIVGDRLNVNHAVIDRAALPDDIKDYIHEQIQTINEEYDKMEENIDSIKDKEKELKDFQKKARGNYVKLEEKVIDTLKDKYEEEIKNNEDKNKALEEADNKYLEALQKNIDKQRKLRDQANAWDDLAEKQKKLSLMRRDTSGSNVKDVKNLEKEVTKTQQDLLDKSVDTIVENLKELYETQKETRELEIEYQKAVIDNAKLVKEANDLISSWNAPEDMYEFMMNNTKKLSEMSQAQIEAEKDEWTDLFNSKEVYMASTSSDFKGALQAQEIEIAKVVQSTSETLTGEADRSLKEITTKVEEAIKSAEEALEDAIKSLEEAKEKEVKQTVSTNDSDTSTSSKGWDVDSMPGAARNEYEKAMARQKDQSIETAVSQVKNLIYQRDSMLRAGRIDWLNQYSLNEGVRSIATSNGITTADIFKKMFASELINLYNIDSILSSKSSSLMKQFAGGEKELIAILKSLGYEKTGFDVNKMSGAARDAFEKSIGKKYASGGLVDYTGPAWVDGTPNKPEAFLSPEDTQNIGMAAKLLASLPIFNYGSANNAVSSNIGDTSIEIHINVDSLGSDYDVDQLVERVKNDIADIARPTGTPVILNKR